MSEKKENLQKNQKEAGSEKSSVFEKKIRNQDFGSRLRSLREKNGLTRDDLSKISGISKTSLQNYELGKLPKGSHLKKLCEILNASADWLLFGEQTKQEENASVDVPETKEKSYLDEEEYIFLPLLDGAVTAGPNGGILYERPDDMYPFKRSWIELKFGRSPERHKALLLVRVQGDSMVPTIYPGEVVMVDTGEHDRVYIRNGKIYMIRMPDGGITLKRVVLAEKGKIVCISDNANYEPFEFEIEPGRTILWYILGRIRWVGREID